MTKGEGRWWRVVVGGGASKERSVSKFAVETHILKGLKEFYNGREGTVQWVVSPDGDFYTICLCLHICIMEAKAVYLQKN